MSGQHQQHQQLQQQAEQQDVAVVALHDFRPQTEDHLPLVQGRMYTMNYVYDDGWARVTDKTNETGFAPASYFKEAVLVAAENEPCYLGQANINLLISILKKKNAGTFCLRERQRKRGVLCLVFRTNAKTVEEVAIRSTTQGFALSGDTVFRSTVSDLLDFYKAHPVKQGWGKLKKPVTRRQFEKELAAQAGRSSRGSSPAPSGASSTKGSSQRVKSAADAALHGSETITGEEKAFMQAHVSHCLEFIDKIPHPHNFTAEQQQVIQQLKRVEAGLQQDQPIPSDVLAAVKDLDVSKTFRRASHSQLGTSAHGSSRPSRRAPPPPTSGATTAGKPSRKAPAPPKRKAPARQRSGSHSPHGKSQAKKQSQHSQQQQEQQQEQQHQVPMRWSVGSVVRQGSPLRQSQQAPPPHEPPAFPPSSHSSEEPVLAVVAAPQPFASVEDVLQNLKPAVIQQIRDENDISYNKARGALLSVLDMLWGSIDNQRVRSMVGSVMAAQDAPVVGGHDEDMLKELFQRISGFAADAQQRGWALGDDREEIQQSLRHFKRLVADANPTVVTRLVHNWVTHGKAGQFEIVETLCLFYQMETRQDLRLDMLQLLVALVKLDMDIIPVLQFTVLPAEVAREIMDTPLGHTNLYPNLIESLRLFALIYSQGTYALSSQNQAYLQDQFLPHLVFLACREASTEAEHNIANAALVALLALNKQIQAPDDKPHPLVSVVTDDDARPLSNRIFMFLNRGEDPVAELLGVEADCELQPSEHSVMKFLQDVYSTADSGDHFAFESDLVLLLEIILRELCDREITDPALDQFLQLLVLVIAHTTSWMVMRDAIEGTMNALIANEHIPGSSKAKAEHALRCLHAQ